MKSFTFLPVVFLLASAFPHRAVGQDGTLEQLKAEMEALRLALDSLQAERGTASLSDDPVETLEERLEQRFAELERKIQTVAGSTAQTAFNPRTTAFINLAGRADSRKVLDASGIAEIDNRAFLRSLELDFRSAVDPYAEAVAIVAIESEAGAEFAAHPEEVYGLIKRLPILESAPWGLKLKVGKFRAPFGVNNRLHLHDLPWTTRPLIVSGFLGTEHGDFFESGLSAVGADLDFFVPQPFPGLTVEMNLDILGGGGLALPGGSDSRAGWLGHISVSRDWNNEHILSGGLSGYTERGNSSPTLIGADITYKWAPSENRMTTSFVLGGEAFAGSFSSVDSLGTVSTQRPAGFYGFAQYQLSYSWYLGVRYDRLQQPDNPDETMTSVVFSASYYTTEFFRIRVGIEHRTSSNPGFDPLTAGLFELNFVFGSHPTEPYWVNR